MEYTRRKRARLVEAEQAARQAAKALRQQGEPKRCISTLDQDSDAPSGTESPRRSPRELSHDSQREVGMNALVDEGQCRHTFSGVEGAAEVLIQQLD
jgi:hypothetical protein